MNSAPVAPCAIEMLMIAHRIVKVPKEISRLLYEACINADPQQLAAIIVQNKTNDLFDKIINGIVKDYLPMHYYCKEIFVPPEQVDTNIFLRYIKLQTRPIRDFLKQHNVNITGAKIHVYPGWTIHAWVGLIGNESHPGDSTNAWRDLFNQGLIEPGTLLYANNNNTCIGSTIWVNNEQKIVVDYDSDVQEIVNYDFLITF
jgi:hypothetical protein